MIPLEAATDVAAAVQAGDIEPQAVLAEHVRRFAATHQRLNALIQPDHTEAAVAAESVDRQLPLAGLPVSIKECFGVRGLRTTLGIPARRDQFDQADAAIVSRLRALGGIVVGKANVPQAMYLHETVNPVWGRTNHPENPERSPGGSSGGDAALVAAGVVPLAIGNDLAGSVRQPAHACGIAALLPASSRLGNGGSFDTLPSFDLIQSRAGFLAGRVADLVLAAEAFGVVPPRAAPPAAHRRIAAWATAGPVSPSAAVRRGLAEAAEMLSSAGHQVEYIEDGLAIEAAWLMFGLLSADGGSDIRRLFAGDAPLPEIAGLLRIAGLRQTVRPPLATLVQLLGGRVEAAALQATGPRDAAGWDRLLERRAAIFDALGRLRQRFDAVLCPVTAVPALRHGTAARLMAAASPCLLANLLDLPAGVVPVTRVAATEQRCRGWSLDRVERAAAATDRGSVGLPVGLQLIGLEPGPAAERTVLDLMATIEAAAGFSRSAPR